MRYSKSCLPGEQQKYRVVMDCRPTNEHMGQWRCSVESLKCLPCTLKKDDVVYKMDLVYELKVKEMQVKKMHLLENQLFIKQLINKLQEKQFILMMLKLEVDIMLHLF